jgi:hypothetical protein
MEIITKDLAIMKLTVSLDHLLDIQASGLFASDHYREAINKLQDDIDFLEQH